MVIGGIVTAGAIVQRDRALQRSYDDAPARAEHYTRTAIRTTLADDDLDEQLTFARRAAVVDELAPLLFDDPAVARVRVWGVDGTLVFSTDPSDAPAGPSQDPIIGSAAAGSSWSRLGVAPVSGPEGGARAVPTPLFQSFVPLRLPGSTLVTAVAEVDQKVAALESRADDPWWIVQAGASGATALLAVVGFLTVARGAKSGAARRRRASGRSSGGLERELQEVASSAMSDGETGEIAELRQELEAAAARVEELERRLAEAAAAPPSATAVPEDVLAELERRVSAAEARAAEAEGRLRAFEDESAEEGSRFRHTLGVRAAGRKLAAPAPVEPEVTKDEPEVELRRAISRGLRGPLTRAAGLTLSLQGAVGSAEGKSVVRQLSTSLRRLDQLTADLHDVRRIADGSLPLNRRRTDLSALLSTTLEEADQLQEDRMVRLDAEHVQVDVDPARLRQIVEGMLEATRERTRTGAAIVVRARTTDRGVMVSVEDENRSPAEIGPELSLAARLAELHGTELLAEGSSYRVFLPPAEG